MPLTLLTNTRNIVIYGAIIVDGTDVHLSTASQITGHSVSRWIMEYYVKGDCGWHSEAKAGRT